MKRKGSSNNVVSAARSESSVSKSSQTPSIKKNNHCTIAQVHSVVQESPLSLRGSQQNFRGILNIGTLVLIVTHARLVLENLIKYGFLLRPSNLLGLPILSKTSFCLCLFLFPLNYLVALLLEIQLSKQYKLKKKTSPMYLYLHILNLFSTILIPTFVVVYSTPSPFHGVMLLFVTMIVWMKLVSYVAEHYKLRKFGPKADPSLKLKSVANPVCYPDNLNIRDVAYYMMAPTLIYQVNYPRTERIRKRFIIRCATEYLFATGLMIFILEQYITPTVKNSMKSLDEMRVAQLLERILKLGIPNLYLWLIMFYSGFHLFLNALAEILRFGDRTFYKDWWNATTLDYYWRSWNLPVHNWLVLYVYRPCLSIGFSRAGASFWVFFASAVAHELLVSAPCHVLRLWAFLGMIAQIPLTYMTRSLSKAAKRYGFTDQLGNFFFWFSFCMWGQPLCILLYYHDYIALSTT